MRIPTIYLVGILSLCVINLSASAGDTIEMHLQSPWQIAMLVYRQHGGFDLDTQQRNYLQSIFDDTEVQGRYGHGFDESPLAGPYYPSSKQVANFYMSWFAVNYIGDKQTLWRTIIDWEDIEVLKTEIDAKVAANESRGPRYGGTSLEVIEFNIHKKKFLTKYSGRPMPADLTDKSLSKQNWKGHINYYMNYGLGVRQHAVMGAWMNNYLISIKPKS
jgi:hypothetical protein